MHETNHRVTMIMGAGAVLDMNFPGNIVTPTTKKITEEVLKPYRDIFNDSREITVVNDIYDELIKKFPVDPNIWWEDDLKPNVNFEILFHVIEQLLSYESVWSGNNKNPYIYPYFAPFTKQNFVFDRNDLSAVRSEYVLRIMRIVNDYNEYFWNDKGKEYWYRDFFESDFKWDVFNFNYDTTVEQSLGVFEDGFEQIPGRADAIFRPKKLMENKDKLSTINHIHGCINYYYKDHSNDDIFETDIHDLYKYPCFDEVEDRMIGRGQSNPVSQNNEEYIAGPIITGLRKTEKLICMPYDFYHGNLHKAIVGSNSMVIVGYSFGDLYVNNLIKRMHAIWRRKERIVLIDKWSSENMEYRTDLEKYLQILPGGELEFIELMSGCTYVGELSGFLFPSNYHSPKYSKNGNLMLVVCGMKEASVMRQEIYEFLES